MTTLGVSVRKKGYRSTLDPEQNWAESEATPAPAGEFCYKQDPQGVQQYGLVAEEVAEVYPELVLTGERGEIEGVQYQGLIPLLVNEVQHQQQVLSKQSQELAALRAQ